MLFPGSRDLLLLFSRPHHRAPLFSPLTLPLTLSTGRVECWIAHRPASIFLAEKNDPGKFDVRQDQPGHLLVSRDNQIDRRKKEKKKNWRKAFDALIARLVIGHPRLAYIF